MKKIAWAYMVELEEGLSKKQAASLLNMIPNENEVIPFSVDEGLLEANSIAYGFLDNEYYEEMTEVQQTLAEVCNDWEKETKDGIYQTSSGFAIKLIHDGHNQQINIETLFK